MLQNELNIILNVLGSFLLGIDFGQKYHLKGGGWGAICFLIVLLTYIKLLKPFFEKMGLEYEEVN